MSAEINQRLLLRAKVVAAPDWATHIAVRNDGSRAEPCIWDENCKDYLDENPKTIMSTPGGVATWAGCYKKAYWTFFSLEELAL